MAQYSEKQIARFWAKVNKNGSIPAQHPGLGRCWLWTGAQNGAGYGQLRISYQQMGAHQVAWELTNGEIPPGMFVRNACGNRLCCNPAHLYLSNSKNNVGPGFNEDVPHHYLTKAEIKALRQRAAAGESKKQLAEEFNVSYTTVLNITSGKTRL